MLSTRDTLTCGKELRWCQYPNEEPSEIQTLSAISLPFHMSKLAEQVVIDKLKSKMAEIIKPTQYAYRPNVSITHALLQYIDDYTTLLDKQKVKFVQRTCLDFSKAFDATIRCVGKNEILRL